MELGIPRSVFLGRRVVAGEPLWLDEDTGAVLAYFREKAVACPGCGQPRDVTMLPAAEGQYVARPFRCHACAERDRATERFRQQGGSGHGLSFLISERGAPA